MPRKKLFAALAAFAFALFPAALFAQEAVGIAKPWQLGFQEPATPVMEQLAWLHDHLLMGIITAISVFVLLLTAYICLRFNRKSNPVPSKTTHNTALEFVWTVIPLLILVVIAWFSYHTYMYLARPQEEPGMTLKVVGHQWYWNYEYPDHGNVSFDSYIIKDEDLKPGQVRLLDVDNRVVVPVDTVIRVQMTSADVIHAWAVPAFGVKKDAVPGRLNETWFKATKTGLFYGQCSELCGVGHGFMPIAVDVVSKEDFQTWIAGKQKEAGIEPAVAAGAEAPASAADEAKPAEKAPEKPAAPAAAKPAAKKPAADAADEADAAAAADVAE